MGRRATSMRQCVNEPGRKYGVDASGNPSSTICEADTYKSVPSCCCSTTSLIGWVADAARCSLPALDVCCRSPGLKKQRACVGCPNGFTTCNTTCNMAFSACGELITAGCCCLACLQPEQHTCRHCSSPTQFLPVSDAYTLHSYVYLQCRLLSTTGPVGTSSRKTGGKSSVATIWIVANLSITTARP